MCMATKNGELYLREQVESILAQLSSEDELVVSDDQSTDQTLNILSGFSDPRIKVHHSGRRGITGNFENALYHSKGEIIFLADQDDVWHPRKIQRMTTFLEGSDIVVCDCDIFSTNRGINTKSFFELNRSGRGFLKNLFRNSYMGCCMAFRREVLTRALPFPVGVAMHDMWIGLIGEMYFKTAFLKEPLVSHRRHGMNASTTGMRSATSGAAKLSIRFHLLKNLMQRRYV